MKDITVIVPLKKYDDKIITALNSVDSENEVIFVAPKDVLDKVKEYYKDKFEYIEEDSDYFTQVNKAVLTCCTKYFSVLGLYDVYLDKWSKIMGKTKKTETSSVILPLNEYVELDGDKRKFLAFGNEIAWDAAFISNDDETQEQNPLGYLTENELKIYQEFNGMGGIIKTEDFISVGMFKPEFKLLAWFEFFMRLVRSNKKIYVIPRVLYSHTIYSLDNEEPVEIQYYEKPTKEVFDEFMKKIIG